MQQAASSVPESASLRPHLVLDLHPHVARDAARRLVEGVLNRTYLPLLTGILQPMPGRRRRGIRRLVRPSERLPVPGRVGMWRGLVGAYGQQLPAPESSL